MVVLIQNNYEDLSNWVANFIASRINNFYPTTGNPFVLGLPTGSSPVGTYKRLIELYQRGVVSFRNVVTFNMDEYVGLPDGDSHSYRLFMQKTFFQYIDIPYRNINIPDGNASDLEEECRKYEAKIVEAGGIQLFLGGIGSNGHIAFNEPGAPFHSVTRVVELSPKTRLANSRFFDNDIDRVPVKAITVGIRTIMDSSEVLLIAGGPEKAESVKKIVEGGLDNECPASALQLHKRGWLICDEDAAKFLKPETVNYFKNKFKENEGL
jgi:glucosamine-6-phosphate deaminase